LLSTAGFENFQQVFNFQPLKILFFLNNVFAFNRWFKDFSIAGLKIFQKLFCLLKAKNPVVKSKIVFDEKLFSINLS